eukprot:TRINITY_DN24130_c0_g2_i2.p1 TRINITY_DN24130_c0_g2~~TRINITY_DN24130_c0_g2_i2.p1  ORF type:complete len:309 (+),score=50.15 TRINITY_DN24130_c0_g2_i2:47-973(+)
MTLLRTREPLVIPTSLQSHRRPWCKPAPDDALRPCPIVRETLRLALQFRPAKGSCLVSLPVATARRDSGGETTVEICEESGLETAHRLLQHYAGRCAAGGAARPKNLLAILNAVDGQRRAKKHPIGIAVDLHEPASWELELCRRTTLPLELAALESREEDAARQQVLYSPEVVVFRADRAGGYGALRPDAYFSIAVLSAEPSADVESEGSSDTNENEGLAALRERLCSILEFCAQRGHRILVIPAWGCGHGSCAAAPEEVACMFRELLRSEQFRGRFWHVTFALPHLVNDLAADVFRRTLPGQRQPLI